jgi:hypothetical protein
MMVLITLLISVIALTLSCFGFSVWRRIKREEEEYERQLRALAGLYEKEFDVMHRRRDMYLIDEEKEDPDS